jgi:transposase
MMNFEINSSDLEELLERVQSKIEHNDYEIIKAITQSYQQTYSLLQEKNISIKKLKTMIFGSKTEKKNPDPSAVDNHEPSSNLDKSEPDEDTKLEPESTLNENSKKEQEAVTQGHQKPLKVKKQKPGHGHLGAVDYPGADRCYIKHDSLSPGDQCPKCRNAKLYTKPSLVFVKIHGQAPLGATIIEHESLRCALCGEVFNAPKSEATSEKYDHTAVAMMALLKYGTGMPFHRLEKLQFSLGIPLPESSQWDVLKYKLPVFRILFHILINESAYADLIYIDDTPAKILEDMGKRAEKYIEEHGKPDHRKGMFTTGVIACSKNKPVITLFFTGHKHAGENLARVLEERPPTLSPPILMCDALSRNTPSQISIILARCFAHARRKFHEIQDSFPLQCHKILTITSYIYDIDRITKAQKMSDQERLIYHQLFSGPAIEQLEKFFKDLNDDKGIEPSNCLGKAVTYCLNHWRGLTLFLREPGAPLDNNICERALKMAILNRKNAYFYRSKLGAEAGDIFMTFIQTCTINKINPAQYLATVLEYQEHVLKNPSEWLPWNYTDAQISLKKMVS